MSTCGDSLLACVTGRFQPVHNQHLELFTLALAQADHLIVAVTNPDALARHEEPTSAHRHTLTANPFTYFERARLIYLALKAEGLSEQVTIVPFDLTRPATWADYVPLGTHHFVRAYSSWERHKAEILRAHGYEVTVLDGDQENRISSSDIRHYLRTTPECPPRDSAGRPVVPRAIIEVLRQIMITKIPGGAH